MLFFNKTKTEPPFPQYEFADRLDKLYQRRHACRDGRV